MPGESASYRKAFPEIGFGEDALAAYEYVS